MNFLELAKTRFSVRNYQTRPVEQEKINRIIEAARIAPTAANRQPIRLVILNSEERLTKLKKAGNLHGAPLAIVVCADISGAWLRSWDNLSAATIDASILTDHMMMEATELGLGTCWICAFNPAVVTQELGLSKALKPVNILVAGYPDCPAADPERHANTRIPLNELVLEQV